MSLLRSTARRRSRREAAEEGRGLEFNCFHGKLVLGFLEERGLSAAAAGETGTETIDSGEEPPFTARGLASSRRPLGVDVVMVV
jgi:hypothetical protein